MSEPVKCSEVIGSCKYSGTISSSGALFCDYLCLTGTRRGCDPEACTCYKSNGRRNKRVVRFSVPTQDKPKCKTILKAESQRLKAHKAYFTRVAKDYCYGEDVLERINNAKTVEEVDRILQMAHDTKFS